MDFEKLFDKLENLAKQYFEQAEQGKLSRILKSRLIVSCSHTPGHSRFSKLEVLSEVHS